MQNKHKILIVGGGSRENALAWKLAQSPKIKKIFIAPGNPGTAKFGENVNIEATEVAGLIDFAKSNDIYLTVVGPEDPLALGIVDEFKQNNLRIWGPAKAAAQIESSKVFSKKLMQDANVPTAKFRNFSDFNEALEYVKQEGAPVVIKASGLALGKGVTICQTLEDAENALRKIMVEKIFGESGKEVVIEEFLEGTEFSAHAFSDGKNFQLLPCSQDHKRIGEGNTGPNTGGVGTIAPLLWVTKENMDFIAEKIVAPVLKTLDKNGSPFVGLLYPGLMMTKDGIKTIEFNSRFGGPECESYMRILKSDLFDIFEACIRGNLNEIKIEWHDLFACCIILCSEGYPGNYEKGKEIRGIEEAEKDENIIVFHAGTKVVTNRNLLTNGGRVLGVSATGESLEISLERAYKAISKISFDGMYYRKDIGKY